MSEPTPAPKWRTLPKVVAVAFYMDGMIFTLPKPARHDDLIKKLNALGIECNGFHGPNGVEVEQGFLLDDGRFARRKPAAAVAERAGQLTKPLIAPPRLFSEDLW